MSVGFDASGAFASGVGAGVTGFGCSAFFAVLSIPGMFAWSSALIPGMFARSCFTVCSSFEHDSRGGLPRGIALRHSEEA